MSIITSATTKLDLSPNEPSFCARSMDLGFGVDATTGKSMETPFTDFAISRPLGFAGTNGRETFFFRAHPNVEELHMMYPHSPIFRDSLTFPQDLALLGTRVPKDIAEVNLLTASKTGAPPCTLFLSMEWSRNDVTSIASELELNKEASKVYAQGPEQFRAKYGDYFVTRISSQTRYTIIWACTAEDPSDIANFQGKLSLDNMSSQFDRDLQTVAADHNVTLHLLSRTYIGDVPPRSATSILRNRMKESKDPGPVAAMKQFRTEAKPIRYGAILRHYRTLYQIGDNGPPPSTSLNQELYRDIRKAMSKVQSALFLVDVVPANADVRQAQRSKIESLVRDIHARRLTCAQDPQPLKTALQDLRSLRHSLSNHLERYHLILSARNFNFETLKQKFTVSTEDSGGVWVKGASTYRLGLVNFNPPQEAAYAMKQELVSEVYSPEQNIGYAPSTDYALRFPETLGYLVGLLIEDCSEEQRGSGSVYIGRDIVFGTKNSVCIKVKGTHRKGMHWMMHAYYILEKDLELTTEESPVSGVGESQRNSISTGSWPRTFRKALKNEV